MHAAFETKIMSISAPFIHFYFSISPKNADSLHVPYCSACWSTCCTCGCRADLFFSPSYGSCMLFLNNSTRVNKIADKLPTDSIFTTQNSHTEFISSSRTSWKCEADEACAHACVQTNRQSC